MWVRVYQSAGEAKTCVKISALSHDVLPRLVVRMVEGKQLQLLGSYSREPACLSYRT